MHRILVATLALPLLLGAGAAMAEQATGTVEKRRPEHQDGGGQRPALHARGQAAGLKLDEIKVGEKVTVEFDVNTNNVYQIDHAK